MAANVDKKLFTNLFISSNQVNYQSINQSINQSISRIIGYKLLKPRSIASDPLHQQYNFFSGRVMNIWNTACHRLSY